MNIKKGIFTKGSGCKHVAFVEETVRNKWCKGSAEIGLRKKLTGECLNHKVRRPRKLCHYKLKLE